LGNAFSIKDKTKLITLPQEIYTPPELINLKLYMMGYLGFKADKNLIDNSSSISTTMMKLG
jgi:hypothetical protein